MGACNQNANRKDMPVTDKRQFKRVFKDISVEFCCCRRYCRGVIRNLSSGGMLISSKEFCIPLQLEFNIIAHFKGGCELIPVKLRRIEIPSDGENHVIVEVMNPARRQPLSESSRKDGGIMTLAAAV